MQNGPSRFGGAWPSPSRRLGLGLSRSSVGWGARAALLLACGCDGPSRRAPACPVELEQGLYYGAASPTFLRLGDSERAAIVRVVPLPDRGRFCSGFVVSRGWILTAGHCVSETTFQVEIPLPDRTEVFIADRHVRHPELDLMLIGGDPARMPEAVAPIPIIDEVLESSRGQLVQVAGYGETESGALEGLEFLVEAIVDVDDVDIVIDGLGRSGACTGDSGGPLLTRDRSGALRAMGALVSGAAGCLGLDRYARLDRVRDWLGEWSGAPAEPHLSCQTWPVEGDCMEGTAMHCSAGELSAEACDGDRICGWDGLLDRFACIPRDSDECGGVDQFGICEGDLAFRCERGELVTEDCTECAAVCARSPITGKVECAGAL